MSDYGKKECPECEGEGGGWSCCGRMMFKTDDNDAICSVCKEHTETNCTVCEGSGEIDRTVEDHQNELEYRAEMGADDKRHGL